MELARCCCGTSYRYILWPLMNYKILARGWRGLGCGASVLLCGGAVWHTPSTLTRAPGPRATSPTKQGKYSRLICVSCVFNLFNSIVLIIIIIVNDSNNSRTVRHIYHGSDPSPILRFRPMYHGSQGLCPRGQLMSIFTTTTRAPPSETTSTTKMQNTKSAS